MAGHILPLDMLQLPWHSAGPLPPRRKRKPRSATLHQQIGTSQGLTSNHKTQLKSSPPIEVALPIVVSEIPATPAKLAPKSWSDLLKDKNGNGPPSRVIRMTDNSPHAFTNLADLISRFDPRSYTQAPLIQPRGLINSGNMCFMNAVLQVLVFCPPFYNLFDRIGREVRQTMNSKTPLMDAMIMFLREFQVIPDPLIINGIVDTKLRNSAMDDVGDPFLPENVYKSMKGNSRFNSMQRGHQEDAEEFLGFLLDGLHEEFLNTIRARETNSKPVTINGSAPIVNGPTQDDEWLEVGKNQKVAVTRTASTIESPISRIFGGHMRSVLRIGGARDSITLEPYQPLQLDIQSSDIVNIVDALASLPTPEVVSEDWHNDKGLKVKATKQVYIESLPPVLILHLKRFLYDNVGGTQKSWKEVGYPLELDVPQQAISPGRRASLQTKYKLIGVVYHHGLSASGGHYTVDVLRQDNLSWIHHDDTSITPVSSNDVAVDAQSDDTSNHGRPNKLAYILFYGQI